MSRDAFMRWEWEGGTPASTNERGEAVSAEPDAMARVALQPTRAPRGRRAATSSLPPGRRRGNSRER
jgi:hypothetical protein